MAEEQYDADLQYAIALSLGEITASDTEDKAMTSSSSHNALPQPQSTFGLLSLNRAQMEQDRLRRLAKRRRSSPSPDDATERSSKRLHSDSQSDERNTRIKDKIPYPNGTVKRTRTRGYPRSPDDITIEEVFQKDKLLLALISSFQWDEEWMMSKVDMTKTKLLLLAFAATDAQKNTMCSNVPKNIRFCFPPMHGSGSMHSKLQLLKFPGYLRLVVPTGNMVPYDWGETGVLENMLFMIDLPRLEEPVTHQPTTFSTALVRFLQAAGVDEKLVHSLASYDFSKTANLGFVYTIPGGHSGESLQRVGYCGLGTSISSLGLASSDPVKVDIACASLGSLNCDFVEAIYGACQGDDGMKEYNHRTNRKAADNKTSVSRTLRDHFRIFFPTKQTVSCSRGGGKAAGTICLQAKWWKQPAFPRELVCDCVNTNPGLLMHRQPGGWAYVGSANLSESAWGRLVKDRATGKAKLNCRNWECGVIIPAAVNSGQSVGIGDMNIFDGVIPIPMQTPGPMYRRTDEPWFYMEV